MDDRRAVLAVTSELPWPLNTGGHLRTFHLLRALAQRFRVRLVVPVESGQEKSVSVLRENGIDVLPAPVSPRVRWREAVRAMQAAARREPYVLYHRHNRDATWAALQAAIRHEVPDVLYLDHLDSWIYRPVLPDTPVVADLHNVYSVLTRRTAAEQPAPWVRLYLRGEAALLDKIERRVAGAADALLTVSDEDRRRFAGLGPRPIYLVPNGVDCAAYAALPTGRRSAAPILLYVGALSWGPNAAAARTLAAEVLPRVRTRIPDARVQLIGRNPGPEVQELGRLDGVEVLGSVPDVLPHLRDAAALIVPLEAGGGTRLKILEAFAAGLPVVSTPLGCEGIDARDNEHLLIADRARLADAIVALLGDPALGDRLAAQARTLARERYDWGIVGAAACAAVQAAIPAGKQQPSANPASRNGADPVVVLDARVVTESGGGPDKTILNSPRFLAPAGYRNLCAYMHPPDDPGFAQLRRRSQRYQAPLVSVPDRGPWDWWVPLQLLQLCRRERVRIWHGHDYKSNALGLLLRRFWPMRLVTTVHGWVKETRRTPLYYRIDRFCLPYYERVLCVSPDLYEQCLTAGVPPERCLLLENGIDTDEYARRRPTAEAKRRLGFPPERLLIGAVGRLSAEKSFDALIRAADQLLRQGHDIALWIVGEGDAQPQLQALIDELGRGDRIRLLGFQPDTIGLYEAMDVFALSSLREGLPNVLLEAMALEVPVAATRVAGIPRLIQDGENGLLVEPGSVDDLTRTLGLLVTNAGLRDRLGQAGRRTIEERYSFAKRMEKVRALYDEMLAAGPRPTCRPEGGG